MAGVLDGHEGGMTIPLPVTCGRHRPPCKLRLR